MKRKKNRKLHGSVLLTVVVVMSLLIVFLFGTLTLATAANNRAHVNYSSSQTNITSRTVVDAAVKAMIQDPDYAKYVMDNADTAEINIPVQISAKHNGKYGTVVGRGDQSTVSVRKEGTKKFYDDSKHEWVDADVLKFTATVRLGGVDTTTSAYVVKPPTMPDPPNDGGLVTVAGAQLVCQTNVYGGTYLCMPEESTALNFDYAYRDDYSDYESAPTNYRQFKAFDESNGNTYIKLEKSGATLEHDVYIYNNLYVMDWSGFMFEKGKGLTVWGDMYFHNNAYGHLEYKMNSNTDESMNFIEIPYIYVDGTIKGTVKLGNKTNPFPLNVFCGNIEVNEPNDFVIAADLYCMNENATSVIKAKNTTSLYSWTGSVVNKESASDPAVNHAASSIYSKGSFELGKMKIDGDVKIEKDCRLKDVSIEKDLYVGGRLDVDNVEQLNKIKGKIYCNDVYVNGVKYEPEKEQENIEFKVPNDTRQYYAFTPTESEDQGAGVFKWKDIFGHSTLDSYETVYYRWEEDFQPAGVGVYPPITNPVEAEVYLKDEPGWPKKLDELPSTKDGHSDFYYVQTDVSRAGITKDSLDENNVLKLNPGETVRTRYGVFNMDDLYSIPCNDSGDGSTEPYTIKTMLITGDNIKADSKVQKLESTVVVYPSYAERHTILGLEKKEEGGIVSIPEVDFNIKNKIAKYQELAKKKIVKTLVDVSKIANPYQYSTFDEQIQDKYETLTKRTEDKSDDINLYESYYEVIQGTGKYLESISDNGATYVYTECTEQVAADPWCNFAMNKAGMYIDKDCILDMSAPGAQYGKNIVFNPGTDEMLVVIRSFDLDHHKIIVDDSMGGKVYFYIEPGVTWQPKGASIMTTSYINFFNNNSNIKFKSSNVSDVDAVDLEKAPELDNGRVNPGIYIYGGEGSKLSIADYKFMTAYVRSPELEVQIMSTNDPGINIEKFYYHDVDVKNPITGVSGPDQFIIGAMNSKEATFDNRINIIYMNGGEDGNDDSSNSRYNVLYYDEY